MKMLKKFLLGFALAALLVGGFRIAKIYQDLQPENTKNLVLNKFYVKNLSSKTPAFIDKKDVEGKTLILHIWASWCGVCKAETETITNLWNQLKTSDKVAFWAVATSDSLEDIQKMKRYQENLFPLALDIGGKVADQMEISAVPRTLIFDQNFKLTHNFRGRLSKTDIKKILSLM